MQLNCDKSHFKVYISMVISATPAQPDPIDALLSAHGLRRTATARVVLGWFLAHPDTSYTHAQLLAALQGAEPADGLTLDRVTLYRLIDRLTQVSLLLCRVDANRVRRYQSMPESVKADGPSVVVTPCAVAPM